MTEGACFPCLFISTAIFIDRTSVRVRPAMTSPNHAQLFLLAKLSLSTQSNYNTSSCMFLVHPPVYFHFSDLFRRRNPPVLEQIICYTTPGLLYQKSHFYIISNINNAIKMRLKCQNDGRL